MSAGLRTVVAKHVRRWAQSVRLDATGRFVCPRHAGALTLSPSTCARLYQRGVDAVRTQDAVDLVSVAPCVGCAIGATHAGCDPAAAARQPVFVPGQGLLAEPNELRRRRSMAGAASSRESAMARKARS